MSPSPTARFWLVLCCVILVIYPAHDAICQDDEPPKLTELLDEHTQLTKSHSELQAEMERFKSIRDDPESTDEEKNSAIEQLEKLKPALDSSTNEIERLAKEIRKQGGIVAGANPGDRVRATEGISGKQESKRTASPCDDYPEFTRPIDAITGEPESFIHLPDDWNSKGGTYTIGRLLKNAERELIEHLVICKARWTYQSALDWDNKRMQLAIRITIAEWQLCLQRTLTYNDEEGKLVARAFEEQPRLKKAWEESESAWKAYAAYVPVAARTCMLSKFSPELTQKPACAQAMLHLESLYRKWERLSLGWNTFKGPEVRLLQEAINLRAERGLEEIRRFFPDCRFALHSKRELTTPSPLIERVLGDAGWALFKKESAHRRDAILRGEKEKSKE